MSIIPYPYKIAPLTAGTPLQPWMTLGIKYRHERDNLIHFDEPTHVYSVKGESKGWISCTTFIHHFFPKFDADDIIKKMMMSKKWKESKWYGMSPSAIKEAWNANGREASEAGTAMHLGIEMVMNDAEKEVAPEVKLTKEWEFFWKYWKEDSQIWEPWRTEWEVWDEELKLAGSIDMIYRNKKDGTFAIYDWKRAKDMKMENNFANGFGPVSHLPDTNYWHYTLQLNIYRWLLEKHYNLKISEMALVVLHPNNKSYVRYKLNKLVEEVDDMMEARRRAVKEGNGEIVVFD
jgi:ATP-dependent exoDNAse (exonuclease V) beta subunit